MDKRSPLWTKVRCFPTDEVVSRSPREVAPQSVGLEPEAVSRIWRAAERMYESGLHPALSLCVRRGGEILIERSLGHLSGNSPDDPVEAEKVPARYDSLFNLFSCSKAVTAMVVHLMDERRLIHLDDRIAEYIPEFARHGKDLITFRHLLTHRAGIPTVPDGVRADVSLLTDPGRIVDLLCDTRPTSVPGRRLAYHALTGGYIIGEAVRRVTGREIRDFLRDEVLDPLRFASFNYGVAADQMREVAVNARTGIRPVPPASWMLERALGVGLDAGVQISNSPAFLTSVIPSGNIIGTAEEGSRFFELLLRGGELHGKRIFDKRTVRRAVAEQSYLEIDSFLGLPLRYGMGFVLGGNRLSLYGPGTPHAFGHVGFTNVVAWADPDRDISVCLMTSGKPLVTPGQRYWLGLLRSISAECRPISRRLPVLL